MCDESVNYSVPCSCRPRVEGFAAMLPSAHTQYSWRLPMGRHQPHAFEHQHHPYFRAAAAEFQLPADASWQVRPVCQAVCWGWNRQQIWYGRREGGKGESAAQYDPKQQHTCTCSAGLWSFSCCLMSNADTRGQWFTDQTGGSNLSPEAQQKAQQSHKWWDSGQARGEHEVSFQESASMCVRLKRSLPNPDQGTVSKGANV